ncbi:response regulator transcription factor [bacterium SCSIO 12741]|nr:response regulator transcription factor [bacterium SCSIO 12741]
MIEKIKVGVVEDNPDLTRAIREKLELFDEVEFLFSAMNGKEALLKLQLYEPDLLLMDINMPVMNGVEATRLIREQYPKIRILILTVFDDDENIFESIVAGASGYLLKDEKPAKLHQAIREIAEGGAPMSPGIALKVLRLIRFNDEKGKSDIPDFQLTKREQEILEHISKGKNHSIIAEDLFISPKTVRKHIENIYSKLQVHNRVEAVQKAIKYGLV